MQRYLVTSAIAAAALAVIIFVRNQLTVTPSYDELSRKMVEQQIAGRGIKDGRVLKAMHEVKRHWFVPRYLEKEAYRDASLYLAPEQYLAQPYIMALMAEALQLKGSERVLEIGTKSGYQTAILCELAQEVYALELLEGVVEPVRKHLVSRGYRNFSLVQGNALSGWPEKAPFDAIIVNYAFEQIPESLLEQLAEGGRLVIAQLTAVPTLQQLVCIVKKGGRTEKKVICEGAFSIYPK